MPLTKGSRSAVGAAACVAASIRVRTPVSDQLFDRFLPAEVRDVSAMYWTPLAVAVRVATWLDEVDARTVVDIGSGAGKLCVVGAIASSARFIGLEQRERLVRAARKLAAQFDVSDRASFVHGALGAVSLAKADAYYLYNSFGENLFPTAHQLDADVELSDARYLRDVEMAEALLREAAEGTYLITYSGFGGFVPRSYKELRVDWTLPSTLRMWQKRRAG